MSRPTAGRSLAALAALLAGVLAAPAARSAPPAERNLTLPSGATLKAAGDWEVTEAKDGLTLHDPEKQLKVELVEVDAGPGLKAAIAAAWSRRRPGFDRQEL